MKRMSILVGGALALAASGCTQVLDWEECGEDRACPSGYQCSSGSCVKNDVAPTIDVAEAIDRDTEWTKDHVYVLKSTIFVRPGATLTIKAGTVIKGEQSSALVIQDGGRIEARGTKTEPIVFTSAQPAGSRAPADWGGVALLGRAPTNLPDASFEAIEPASDGRFGGTDVTWNCGVMQYVRVEYAGYAITQDAEHNGLTLAGCGNQTLIDNLQIHMSGDDGVQILGGTVNLKHIVMTQVVKDGLDWEGGWRGRAQFVVIQQGGDQENAFETVNNDDLPDVEPRSEPTIFNFTLIGSGGEGGNQRGLFLEAGAGGHFHNGLFIGQTLEAIDIIGPETVANLSKDPVVLEITHSAFYDVGVGSTHYFPLLTEEVGEEEDDESFDEDAFFRKVENGNVFGVDPQLPDAYNLEVPGWVPPANAMSGIARLPSVEFDQSAQYLGAFKPGAESWADGWTSFPAN